MPAYKVLLDLTETGRVQKGADGMAVFAADATAAKEVCKAYYDGIGTAWNSASATVTEIVQDADFNGWTVNVSILGGFGGSSTDPVTVSVVGDGTTNTIDEIGAALVVLLTAVDGIVGSAYNSTTQVLTVAETTDGLGDQTLLIEYIPPGGYSSVDSLIGTTVDGGAAGALLSTTLPADAAVIPIVSVAFKQAL